MSRFRIEPLAKHSRDQFDCGNDSLNSYVQRQARQDQKKRFAVCYLLIEQATDEIAGYYTLSAGSVDAGELPEELVRKLPRYSEIPVVRLGRLAVALPFQGQGAGGAMLFDTIKRTAVAEIAAYALIVDAIDENAVKFYKHHGFIPLPINDRVLFLPISDGLRQLAGTQTKH